MRVLLLLYRNRAALLMCAVVLSSIGVRQSLGYDLKYKINPHLMWDYLTPAYLQLRRSHSELNFVQFIEELVKVREQARKTLAEGDWL